MGEGAKNTEIMSLLDRFTEKYIPVPESGCWLWIGSSANGGYGQIKNSGKKVLAHRVAWMIRHGSIPDSVDVLHRCDVPCCVNPDHLFLGTDFENQRDSYSKGRGHFQRVDPRAIHKTYKISQHVVSEIVNSSDTLKTISERYGISVSYACNLRAGRYRAKSI